MDLAIKLAENGLVPDSFIRSGIRKLLRERLASLSESKKTAKDWIKELEARPLAESTEEANEQHYEIPSEYFRKVLGTNLKYSCGYWKDVDTSLEESEAAMLELSCERADLKNGQAVLELGCGWGSLSLWMAAHYPESQITGVSNSNSQREYIESQAKARGLTNLRIITCDINEFQPDRQFDRIVSVEMFEHVRNHRRLFAQISEWLSPKGKLFVHVFSHHEQAYLFEVESTKDWMSQYFFTGGVMPSADLLPTAADQILELDDQWKVNGKHYSKTLEAWLAKQDQAKNEVLDTFRETYGKKAAKVWSQRWRIFYMACSELFAYRNGEEWPVMHYLFSKP